MIDKLEEYEYEKVVRAYNKLAAAFGLEKMENPDYADDICMELVRIELGFSGSSFLLYGENKKVNEKASEILLQSGFFMGYKDGEKMEMILRLEGFFAQLQIEDVECDILGEFYFN